MEEEELNDHGRPGKALADRGEPWKKTCAALVNSYGTENEDHDVDTSIANWRQTMQTEMYMYITG